MLINLAKIFNLFYPNICCICRQSCDASFTFICSTCLSLLPKLEKRCVKCCSVRLEAKQQYCNKCIGNKVFFNKIFAMYPYAGIVKDLLHSIKYSNKLEYAKLFGSLLKYNVENSWYKQIKLPDLIVTVPLHKSKLLARGFNQTEEIIRQIKSIKNIKICTDLIVKHKASKDQASLSYDKRKNNLSNCFKVNIDSKYYNFLASRGFASDSRNVVKVKIGSGISDKLKIAIFDDVVTTMTTTHQISTLLQQNFAVDIDIWCICRA